MPNPPKHLSAEARRLWRDILEEYEITDAAGLRYLLTACECLDAKRQAEAIVKHDGQTVTDRFGQPKPHPLLVTIRDNTAQMMLALKNLNLDLEPLRDAPGRPPGR
jgi:P27 family predicted phage terminase small subunit